MNDKSTEPKGDDELQALKRLTATVYLCQILTFMLAGLPLLVGVAINFYKRNEVQGTWLESHFNWQIKTTWVALAGFAFSGFTLELGIGIFSLMFTLLWMIYRIAIGWFAFNPFNLSPNRLIYRHVYDEVWGALAWAWWRRPRNGWYSWPIRIMSEGIALR